MDLKELRFAARPGFSLVESIVALTVLAVILGALIPAMAQGVRVNSQNEIRTGAVAVAQQEVDNLRALPSASWPASGTTTNIATGTTTYSSRLTYVPYCEGATCFVGARLVTVEVLHNGRPHYRVQTVFTALD